MFSYSVVYCLRHICRWITWHVWMVSCWKLNVISIWSFRPSNFCISLLNWVDLWKTNLDVGGEFNYVIWVTYDLKGSNRWLGMWHFASSLSKKGLLESHLNRLYVNHVLFLKEMCEIVSQGIKPSHFSPTSLQGNSISKFP